MNNSSTAPETPKETWWHRLQRGQALMEYWPTIPVGVMVMISAAAVVGPMKDAFLSTSDALSGISCDVPNYGPMSADLDGGHRIEVVSSNYNGEETTVVVKVSSGDKPAISHVMFGLSQEDASKIVYSNYEYEMMYDSADPKTGKLGIKFDQGYGGGGGEEEEIDQGPKPKGRRITPYRPRMADYVEERTIALTFAGQIDFTTLEVTTKSGSDQVSTGTVNIPTTGTIEHVGTC